MASIWSGLGSTLGRQFGKRDAIPFLAGAVGAFVLLPKFAYSEEDLAGSYWIKQYRPELLHRWRRVTQQLWRPRRTK